MKHAIFHRVCIQTITFLAVLTCSGQSYYFRHYQADDGLAHNTVVTVMQDSRGMMWMGTKGGLNRFDGYCFRNYKNEGNKFGTIGDNVILSICEDRSGMLWIGTGRGLYRYDPVREVFSQPYAFPAAGISHIQVDSSNNLWFLANGALYKYDQSANRLTATGYGGTCLTLDRTTLWVGHEDGSISRYELHGDTEMDYRIQILDPKLPIQLRLISKICSGGHGLLLVGTTKQGVKAYNTATGQVHSLPLQNNNTEIFVRDIVQSGPGEYWIATESGIYIYNLKLDSAHHLLKSVSNGYSISDNAVYALCRDNQGGLWAGTYFGGLNYFSAENARFQKFYPADRPNALSGNAVREICGDDKGQIWIGTEDAGISRLDPRTGQFRNFTADGRPGALSYPNIHGLLAVGDKLYTGPFQHGLEIMDMNSGRIIDRFRLVGEKDSMFADFVMCIYRTRNNELYVGTTGNGAGLYSYDPVKRSFTKCRSIPGDAFVYSILEDHEGTIWIGSLERGTFWFNSHTGKKGNIRFAEQLAAHDYRIQGIFEDSDRALWFATEGGGLIRLAPDRKTFKKITTEDGLPTNNLFRMLEDGDKNLWVSSLKGLICLNLRTEKFKVYTQSNGLITDEFNYNSAYKDAGGRMYFGSVKGLIAFNPAEFGQSGYIPSTYITGFQINDREVVPLSPSSPLKRSIMLTDTIVLDHNQSNFSIEFAALNYASPAVTRYKYRMEGLGKGWTYLSSNRKAYFTDLSAGDYRFTVQAESNIGSWTGRPKRLFITILPPFWKSRLAYMTYMLLVAAVIFLAVRYYHRYLEKKNLDRMRFFEHEKEKEIYEAKIEFFTSIAHEVQTPLTLILGPLERILKKIDEYPAIKKSLLMMEKNGRRLLELTTQLLDFRKTEADQFGLNFVNADITAILQEQVTAFTPEAQKAQLSLTLNLPPHHLEAFVDPEAFIKICSNLISNALKYAASKATISMMTGPEGQHFVIRFCNDGKSIPEEFREKIFEPFFRLRSHEKQGTGIGLSLAKSLTELHNGTLRLVSGETDRIAFELTLPVHQKFEFTLSKWKSLKE